MSATQSPAAPDTGIPAQVRQLYRPELDMLRFFAFLGVFLLHGAEVNPHGRLHHQFPHIAGLIDSIHYIGSFGLSLFFVLSAFLITSLLFREKRSTGSIDVRRFYLRRILRIWPLYLGFSLLAALVGLFWHSTRIGHWELLALCLMYANWYWMRATVFGGLVIPLWSISVEEQFYLVWPLVVRRITRSTCAWICCGIAVASLACTWLSDRPQTPLLHLWFNTGVEAVFFAAGGLLAVFCGMEERSRSAVRFASASVFTVLCWITAEQLAHVSETSNHVAPGRACGAFLLIAVGAAALLWGFLHIPRILIRPSLVHFGRISFGLYVFHYLGLRLGASTIGHIFHARAWIVASFLITVGLAQLSYSYYEKPFLRLKYRFERIHSHPA